MTTPDHLFLIAFDRAADVVSVTDLGSDLEAAMQIYAAKEREATDDNNLEVVLIGSPSEAALRRTHSSYFGTSTELLPRLARSGD